MVKLMFSKTVVAFCFDDAYDADDDAPGDAAEDDDEDDDDAAAEDDARTAVAFCFCLL